MFDLVVLTSLGQPIFNLNCVFYLLQKAAFDRTTVLSLSFH